MSIYTGYTIRVVAGINKYIYKYFIVMILLWLILKMSYSILKTIFNYKYAPENVFNCVINIQNIKYKQVPKNNTGVLYNADDSMYCYLYYQFNVLLVRVRSTWALWTLYYFSHRFSLTNFYNVSDRTCTFIR